MLKNQIVFFLLLIIGTANAQSEDWAAVGTTWNYVNTYSLSIPAEETAFTCTVERDTTINGINCSKIIRSDDREFLLTHSPFIYTYNSNDSIFVYSEEYDEFTLLYRFNLNVGDSYTFISPVSAASLEADTLEIEITAVTEKNLASGQTVKQYQTTQGFSYYDGIGSAEISFLPEFSYVIPELRSDLVCYGDETGDYKIVNSRSCSTLEEPVEWAPIGAEWFYNFYLEINNHLWYATVEKDTMINEISCRKIRSDFYFNGELNRQDAFYTFARNDSVFHYVPNFDDFFLLYVFGLEKEDSYDIRHQSDYNENEIVEVTITIKDVKERTLPSGQIVKFYESDEFIGGYYDNIGSVATYFFYEECCRTANYNIQLRCHNNGNELFQFREGASCLVPIENLTESTDWSIYPTLISDAQPLTIEKNTPAKVAHQLTIRDLTGKIIHQSELSRFANEWEINALNNMPQGVYLVSIANAAQRLTLRVVKM